MLNSLIKKDIKKDKTKNYTTFDKTKTDFSRYCHKASSYTT